jgi:hypothetical protein
MIDVASRTLRRRLRVERRPTRLSDQVRGRSSDIALDDMDLERGSIA